MRSLILGGGGFIGHHLIKELKAQGQYVKGVDLKYNEYEDHGADEFEIGDLRSSDLLAKLSHESYDWIFQLAADMGGAGYVFTGEHDAEIMHNSALINLNVLQAFKNSGSRIFYASSACIYPEQNQMDPNNPNCSEDSAYPASPDSEYGWEKLFSERLYQSFARNFKTDIRIGRFHNIYGTLSHYSGGLEKAPAALCRKVASGNEGELVEVWGSGAQTRSFLHISDCIRAILALMKSNYNQPINIGSEEMISINNLTEMIILFSGKSLEIKNISGPVGVQGRCSDNNIIRNVLSWQPKTDLHSGMSELYVWVQSLVSQKS